MISIAVVAKNFALFFGFVVLSFAVLIGNDWPNSNYSVQTPEDRSMTLKDGRILSFLDIGDKDGFTVIMMQGTPHSRLSPWSASFLQDHKIRLLIPERPGYGLSTYKENLSFLNYVDDVKEFADVLHLQKFAIVSASGGGPFAMAVMYKMPERVSAAVIACSPAPVPLTNDTVAYNLMQLQKSSPLLYQVAVWFTRQMQVWIPMSWMSSAIKDLPEGDQKVLNQPGFLDWFETQVKEAMRQGSKHGGEEFSLIWNPWGFEVEDISPEIPVLVMHGKSDKNVPVLHAEYLCKHIPTAKCQLLDGAGHLFLMDMDETIGSGRIFEGLKELSLSRKPTLHS